MTKQQYREAVEWLFVQIPSYQNIGSGAYKPGLNNIRNLCSFFGNPQESLKTIHIGGTNGKGSTSNMVASVMQEAGYRVGLYNSPHLIDFTERIKINGINCEKEFVYHFIQQLKNLPSGIDPSFFEFTTVMAFEYFKQKKVDYAVIEVGLGGRLDATNTINPMVTALTNVSLDHQNLLGDTLEEIASEKAGIIKPLIPVISGEENPHVTEIFMKAAAAVDAPFTDATRIETPYQTDLEGVYQKKNIKTAIAVIGELRRQNIDIPESALQTGLLKVYKNTGFIGRWFKFSEKPLVICDTAHNQAGLEQVFSQLNGIPHRKHIILGFVNDKKIDGVLEILPTEEFYYFVKPDVSRGRNPTDYEMDLKKFKIKYKIFESLQDAYLFVKQQIKNGEMIFIGGSNFIVGEFLEKNLEQ